MQLRRIGVNPSRHILKILQKVFSKWGNGTNILLTLILKFKKGDILCMPYTCNTRRHSSAEGKAWQICHFVYFPFRVVLLPLGWGELGEKCFAGCGTERERGRNLDGIVIRHVEVTREGGRRGAKASHCQSHTSMSLLQCICSVKNAPYSPCWQLSVG